VSSSGVCDLDAVLNALEGDRELLSGMIKVFLKESPALLERTRDALAARDAVAVERSAHTIRGALANFAARQACATARRLQESAGQADWESALTAHAELEEQIHDVVRVLTAFGSGEAR
jgi:HPt (histidine-containing phosphotransfer) domain-containing protein